MNLGVTGSRWGSTEKQSLQLVRFLVEHFDKGSELRHGACTGIDEELALLGNELGYIVIAYPPLNKEFLSQKALDASHTVLAARGYLTRNRAIVDDCDELLAASNAMIEQPRSGTWMTIRYAIEIARKFTIVWPDGVVTNDTIRY